MNERIKKLAEQAGYYIDPDFDIEFEKFAELIVQECGNVAWQHTPETEELEYSHLIKDKILEHFGVEE
jgi:hypothetical protein